MSPSLMTHMLAGSTDTAESLARYLNRPRPHITKLVANAATALTTLPAEVVHFTELKELEFYYCNRLTSLPAEVGQLKKLEKLVINGCRQLASLPPQLGGLEELQELDLSGCVKLTSLPGEIGLLTKLTKLTLTHIKMASLPAEFALLENLTCLTIDTCEKLVLGEEVGGLKELMELRLLHCNALVSLPAAVGELKKLKILYLFDCQKAASLPVQVGQLEELETLTVIGCNRLKSLDGELPLKNLRKLEFTHCRELTSLPAMDQLERLHELKLYGCAKLASLPAGMGALKKLNTLTLEFCERLSALPAELGPLLQEELTTLTVVECRALRQPPFELATQGVQAIANYFRDLQESGSLPSMQCKLLMLGDGEAGKTSLLRSLKAGRPMPAAGGSSGRTINLELSKMALDGEDGRRLVDFSCWDLGGQVRYAPAQQPFIVRGALYLLVVRADEAVYAMDNAEVAHRILHRWLHYLRARAPGSVVQIVLSHVDKLSPPQHSRRPADLEEASRQIIAWLIEELTVCGRTLPDAHYHSTCRRTCAGPTARKRRPRLSGPRRPKARSPSLAPSAPSALFVRRVAKGSLCSRSPVSASCQRPKSHGSCASTPSPGVSSRCMS